MTALIRPVVVLAMVTMLLAGGEARAETVLRLGTVAPEGSRYAKDLRSMGAEMERMTEGQVKIKWFMAARLGDEHAMGKTLMAADGLLDGMAITGVGLPFLVPEMRVWIYPGLFQSYDEVDLLENRYKEEFAGYFDQRGIVLVTWADVGFNYVIASEKIDTWDELKQHRVWLWTDDDTNIYAAKLIGLATDDTTLAGLQDWLRDKKIDAWIYPPLAVVGMGLQGYAKYMSDMPFGFMAGAFILRKDVFDALPKDTQRAIMAVGRKWENRLTKSWRAENNRAVAAMQKQGTKVVKWSDEERQKFFQATAAERGNFAKKWNVESLMRRFSDDLDQLRAGR